MDDIKGYTHFDAIEDMDMADLIDFLLGLYILLRAAFTDDDGLDDMRIFIENMLKSPVSEEGVKLN